MARCLFKAKLLLAPVADGISLSISRSVYRTLFSLSLSLWIFFEMIILSCFLFYVVSLDLIIIESLAVYICFLINLNISSDILEEIKSSPKCFSFLFFFIT